MIQSAGLKLVETKDPYPLLDSSFLFLGEIPRVNDFEMGMPNAYYQDDEEEKRDAIEDDTAVVVHLKGKGLVVLSGCAHSGIVNTTKYAREVTGIDKIHAVMGGFHLTGNHFEPFIDITTESLKELNPDYVIPTHCTGRKAINTMEKEMPSKFLLSMAGTKMTFES
jgi:7,8-dihydropterin-6-yl-methyl-4-(beta-D-ribofuranosyl)aminobenzene 5'-phosphate synthase